MSGQCKVSRSTHNACSPPEGKRCGCRCRGLCEGENAAWRVWCGLLVLRCALPLGCEWELRSAHQKPFEKMIIMKYDCVGIGVVKMTVGVRRRTHEKVQYCITALEI